ncbi:MAG: MFS transporter, partial [Pseudomonadota bacterium]
VLVVVAPLADRFGRRPVLLWSMGVFALASAGSALAPDIWTFLGFRMLQAGSILGSAVTMAIARDIKGERGAAGLIGLISGSMAVAPMLGPVAGGLLTELYGWRACFWALAGLGAAAWALCLVDLGETRPRGAVAQSGAALRRAMGALLVSGRFAAHSACVALGRGSFYVYVAGAPLAATAMGASAAEAGMWTGAITFGFLTGSFSAARLARRAPPGGLILAGRVLSIIGPGAGLIWLALDLGPDEAVFGFAILVGFGNGIGVPGSLSGAMSVRPDLAAAASGLTAAMSVTGGAVLTGLATAWIVGEAPAERMLTLLAGIGVVGLATAIAALRLDRAERLRRRGRSPIAGA